MTRRLNVLYICMKFRRNICNGYQVKERTRFCHYLCYKGDNLKNTHARVMVLVHDTLSQCALQIYEVSLKYLQQLSSYRADTVFSLLMLQGGYLKNTHARVMVLEHVTSSQCALQMYEVSLKYLK